MTASADSMLPVDLVTFIGSVITVGLFTHRDGSLTAAAMTASADSMLPVDPVTLEVIRNALSATAEEMSLVVMRSARSPLLREAGDLSSALTDAEGHLIAQGRDIPMHLGVMSFTVREFLKRVPKSRLAPGDVWFLNLPEIGGNHLPDGEGDPAGVRRWRGGRVRGQPRPLGPTSGARCPEATSPGPPTPGRKGCASRRSACSPPPARIAGNLDVVLANVRGAEEREGDVLAQMAATRDAEEHLHRLFAEHGTDTVLAAVAAIHDRTEARMREALAAVPDGVYHGEDWLDDDAAGDEPVAVRVRVTIAGDRATFDFSETADAARGPVNTTPFIAAASVFYVVKTLFGPDVQPSGGGYRPLEIVTRPGSLLDPGPDRPVVGGNHETSQRVADAVFRALEPTGPERLSAGGPTTSGLVLFGGRRADGAWATFYETHGGGEGARHDRDGAPVVRESTCSNVMNTPAEVVEAEYPIRVECQRLRRGSGGAGRHRGGDGLHREYRVLCDNMSVTTMFERRVVPPYGLQGRSTGSAVPGDRRRWGRPPLRACPERPTSVSAEGDVVVVESCGGGGYGAPEAADSAHPHEIRR